QNVDVGKLYVKEVFVDGGPALKRIQANTMGRAFRILKRQSHVTIKLDTRKAVAASAPKGAATKSAKSPAKSSAKSPAQSAAKAPAKTAKRTAKGGK
ncbi:MAG: uL22 family ribosomal protein, partial [Thermoanaerobaculia bacterium]